MTDKSITLQKQIKIGEQTTIAYLSAQISCGYGSINMSVQIIDKVALEINKELFKSEYFTFIEEVNSEAINNGWTVLV